MNPWKSKEYKKIYSDHSHCSGIYFRYEKDVNPELKEYFTVFSKWLRKNYYFPIRVNVYVKSCEQIKLRDGTMAYGSFRYFDTYDEPYIRIPTGDYDQLVEEGGKEYASRLILSSLVHEITHYFQWVNNIEQTDRSSEWQANYYRFRIVDLFNKEKNRITLK